MHFEEQEDGFVELICHTGKEPFILHVGKGTTDHVYIMDKGKTVDHMVFTSK